MSFIYIEARVENYRETLVDNQGGSGAFATCKQTNRQWLNGCCPTQLEIFSLDAQNLQAFFLLKKPRLKQHNGKIVVQAFDHFFSAQIKGKHIKRPQHKTTIDVLTLNELCVLLTGRTLRAVYISAINGHRRFHTFGKVKRLLVAALPPSFLVPFMETASFLKNAALCTVLFLIVRSPSAYPRCTI